MERIVIFFLTFLFFTSPYLIAQNLTDMDNLFGNLANYAIDDHIKNPKIPLSGLFLKDIFNDEKFLKNDKCIDKKVKKESKNSHWEVLLIIDTSNIDSKEYSKISRNVGFNKDISKIFDNYDKTMSKVLTYENVLKNAQMAQEFYQSENKFVDPIFTGLDEKVGELIFLESLMRSMASSNLNDEELGKKASQIINEKFTTSDDKYEFLSSMAQYFASNYNDSRNPGANNKVNNPENLQIPNGDLTLQQIISAAVKGDRFSGGVCNDISENIAIIGKYLFPDQDVLTMTSGTHFATIISDGKTSKVINYGNLSSVKNGLSVYSHTLETNTRISKVNENGQLKEIAILDTQTGELVETAFQSDKRLLRADTRFDKISAVIKKVVESEKKQRSYNLGVAAGDLSDQRVLVVAAKYESISEKNKFYAGIGSSIGEEKITERGITLVDPYKMGVHIKLGYERKQIIFKNPTTNLEMTNGVHLTGSMNGENAGSIDLINKVNFKNLSSSGFNTRINLETQHTLGPSSWGETTGKMSTITAGNIAETLQNLNFHYNQVSIDVQVDKKITNDLAAGANVNSRISPVGSQVSFTPNLLITKPNGVEVFIFAGYEKKIKGTSTKHNILPDNEGGLAGVDVRIKNIIIGGSVRGIGSSPYYNGAIKVPLSTKKK